MGRRDGRRVARLALLLLAALAHGAAAPRVEVTGLERAEDRREVARLVTDVLAAGGTPERARALLLSTGDLEDAAVEVRDGVVRVEILEAPILRRVEVSVTGGDEERLASAVPLRRGRRVRDADLEKAVAGGLQVLAKRGHPGATVDVQIRRLSSRYAEATVAVAAGPPVLVRDILVEPSREAAAVATALAEQGIRQGAVADGVALEEVGARWRDDAARHGRVGTLWRAAILTLPEGDAYVRVRAERGREVEIERDGEVVSSRKRRRLLEGAPAEPEALALHVATRLEEDLEARGHFDRAVTARVEGDRVRVTVAPGPRYRLGELEVDLPPSLRGIVKELHGRHRRLSWRRARLTRRMLEEDRAWLAERLAAEGYGVADVSAGSLVRDGERLHARYVVKLGPRHVVGALEVRGAVVPVPPLPLAQGGAYSDGGLQAAVEAIRRAHAAAGYLEATVKGLLAEAASDGGVRRVPVVIDVSPGRPTIVETVVVEGALTLSPEVVRSRAGIAIGSQVTAASLSSAEDALRKTPLFARVRVDPEEGSGDESARNVASGEAVAELRPVRVEVAESPRFRFRYGVGYNTEKGPFGTLLLSDLALLRGPRALSILARGGKEEHRGEVTLHSPYLWGPGGTSFTLFSGREKREGFAADKYGGQLQIGLLRGPLGRGRHELSLRLLREEITLDDVDISEEEIPREERDTSLLSGAVSYLWDGRDDPLRPRRGLRLRGLLEVAGRGLSAEEQFFKADGECYGYVPLPLGLTLAAAVGVGAAIPWGADEEVAIAKRFFLGGLQGMRAFSRDGVGPRDPVTGEPLGGEAYHLETVELRATIAGPLGAAVFYERGSVAAEASDLVGERAAQDAGFGLRYETSAGVLRVEYAREIAAAGAPEDRVLLSFGETF